MATLKYVIVILLSTFQILIPYGKMLASGGINSLYDGWKNTDTYTSDYAVTIEKDPDRDFVILNLADTQVSTKTLYSEEGEYTERLINTLVEEVKPDLITLTGDNGSGDLVNLHYIKLLDSFGIPWAPIMGNHDGDNGNRLNEAWVSFLYMNETENCLFRAGPADMGFGNYIINITENGKIIHTLYMLDSHSSADNTEQGKINYSANGNAGYDHLWATQLEWYQWCVNGITQTEGRVVESTAFMHIPVYQYKLIQSNMVDGDGYLLPEYESLGFGKLGETVCTPEGDNGFFALAKDLGSTTMMIFGHDHKNNMCVEYEGIRLNYGQKSGHGSYYYDEAMGGSVITINSVGQSDMYHIDYVDSGASSSSSPLC